MINGRKKGVGRVSIAVKKENGGVIRIASFDVLERVREIVVGLEDELRLVGEMFDEPFNGVGMVKVEEKEFKTMKEARLFFKFEELKSLRIELVKKVGVLKKLSIKRAVTIEAVERES